MNAHDISCHSKMKDIAIIISCYRLDPGKIDITGQTSEKFC